MTDAEAEAAGVARREYRAPRARGVRRVDLLLTPTLMFVAPPADIDELAWRERIIRFTYPFNLSAGRRSRCLAVRPRTGCPASVQLVGRPGDDARVLAAGLALEAALAVASRA